MANPITLVKYDTTNGDILNLCTVYVCAVPLEKVLGALNPNEALLTIEGTTKANSLTHKVNIKTKALEAIQ